MDVDEEITVDKHGSSSSRTVVMVKNGKFMIK